MEWPAHLPLVRGGGVSGEGEGEGPMGLEVTCDW